MSLLSKLTGIDIKLSRIVPGASESVIRKAVEALRLDAPTLRILANAAKELANEKEIRQ